MSSTRGLHLTRIFAGRSLLANPIQADQRCIQTIFQPMAFTGSPSAHLAAAGNLFGGWQPQRFVSRSSSSLNETPPLEIDETLRQKERIKSEKEALRERIGVSGEGPTRAEILHDFKYLLTTKLDQSKIEPRFAAIKDEDRPLVILAGWAGANQKNLSKYSDIYQRAGCYTLGYNLPSRFVFTDTSEIPHIAREILQVLESEKLLDRPIFLHLMSDTGLMVFQGLDIAQQQKKKDLKIVGAILDSCPGPQPKATLPRTIALCIVNWICCRKDGHNLMGCIRETSRLLSIRIFPSIIRHFQGLPLELSMMSNKWSGHYYKDLSGPRYNWPELYLYSKTDFYLPWTYLEKEVLEKKRLEGRDIRTKCWKKSAHVAHLRNNRKEYEETVFDFINDKYVKNVAKNS